MEPVKPRRKKGWMNLKVTEVVEETYDTKTFIMVDAEDGGVAFDYIAGQYLTFRFDDVQAKPIVRSYTMSSSPCQPDMCAFTVKRVEGGVISNWLCDEIKVGSVLRARGPIGRFVYEPEKDRTHLFMVAGGSGVTPFVSIMRQFAGRCGEPGSPQKMSLLVSYRSGHDLICWPDLEKIAAASDSRVITTLSRENLTDQGFWFGRIDDEMLAKAIDGNYHDTTFMTCGPEAIMNLTVRHLEAKGVPAEHVKTESFES